MSNFANTKVPIAQQNMSHLDLSFDHVTTSSFMRLQPLGYLHLLPNQSIDLNAVVNIRPAPMPLPTYGRMRMALRYFFVPYRLCFPKWDSFKQDVISSNSSNSAIPVKPPYFTCADVIDFFKNIDVSEVVVSGGDFTLGGVHYKLKPFGRYLYKIFYSLGYDILADVKTHDFEFNALALLAWARLYIDWYYNSQYMDGSLLLGVQRLLEYDDPSTPLHLTGQNILDILSLSYVVNYQSNPYFEDCWDEPFTPSSNQYTQFSFNDVNSIDPNRVTIGSNGYPAIMQTLGSNPNVGSYYIHEALNRLTQYMKRHAISGAREIDRFLSETGHQSDYLRLMRAIYVGSNMIDINVGDIYATATSSNGSGASDVGDFAGRGFGAGQKPCSFTADEAGIFIAAASIHPSGGYYQGYDRHNRHIDKLDFYEGSLDGLGPQVLEKGEVYVSKDDAYCGVDPTAYRNKFGYIKRYGEYTRSINRVSGDVALPSVFAGGDSWHLMREFSDSSFIGGLTGQVHSVNFASGVDNMSFNRIFNYQYADYDCFFVFAHFSVSSYSPVKPMFDMFEFDDNAKKQITMNVNGSKVN